MDKYKQEGIETFIITQAYWRYTDFWLELFLLWFAKVC